MRALEAMQKTKLAEMWREQLTKALSPLPVVVQCLCKLEAARELGHGDDDNRTAERCGHILLAVANAVAKGDEAMLARLERVATGQEAERAQVFPSPRARTRHRALVVATIRGAIRREEGSAGWADCRAVVSRVLRGGRVHATHADIVEALAELEAAGEVDRREVEGLGQVRLTVSALQVGMWK